MAEGIRLVSVRRGIDPRRFALLSFGGAAGLHVTDVARQLDLRRVVVPRAAAVLSAWGMLATDLRFEVSRTHIGDTAQLDGAGIKRLFAEMEQEGMARLRASFDGPVRVQRSVEMRYGEQIFEITVPLDGIDWEVADPLPQIVERFHSRHEELYTYALRDQGAVLVNARAAVTGVLPEVPQEPTLARRAYAAPRGERRIWMRDWTSVPVFEFDALAPDQTIAGPAIVEAAMTTVLLRSGNRARVTPHGWLDIAIAG
jgi:N-methylhydantoinase A